MSHPLIAVISVTYESHRCLQRLRRSIKEHTEQPYTWVIVDNGSKSPGAKAELLDITSSKEAWVLKNSKNAWFTKGCNDGITFAVDKFNPDAIVLLNPDCSVTPGWLDALWAIAQQPNVGVVGAVLVNETGIVVHAGGVNMGDHLGNGEPYDAEQPWAATRRHDDWVTGACLLITKPALEAVGGKLDEEFTHFFSDIKLCRDVRAAGLEVWMSGHVLTHSVGGSRQ